MTDVKRFTRKTASAYGTLLVPASLLVLVSLSLLSGDLQAQGPPTTPVRYTEVRTFQVQERVALPGTAEARTSSLVASEIAGKVEEFAVREGERVVKGHILARLNTATLERQLEAVTAEHKEATARLKLAEANLKRVKNLYESEILSEQQMDSTAAEFAAWTGRVEKLEADRARIQNDVDQATIRAPFTGVVVEEHTEVGEWVSEGGAVVEIVSLHPIEVRVDVPERHYRNLRLGSPSTVTFESLPGLEVKGRITAIIPRANVEARTYPVKVRIPNRRGRIGVGMLARVSFPAGGVHAATLVPKDALVTKAGRQFVYRIRRNQGKNTVEQVPVRTGAGVGAWIQVNGSIQPGERVVTRGNERLAPGQAVEATAISYASP